QVLVQGLVHVRRAGEDPGHLAARVADQRPGIVRRDFQYPRMGRHDPVEPGAPAVVAAVGIDAGARTDFLQRFTETIAVAIGDGDLVVLAQLVLVDAGDVAALDEVRHAADHVPGPHEALQVDRPICRGFRGAVVGRRWRIGSHCRTAQGQGQQHSAERADRGHAGAGSSGLARAWSLCARHPSMVSQPVRSPAAKLTGIDHRRIRMRTRPRHRPPTERVSERADPRLLRVVPQLALAGLAVVLVWPAARGSSAWLGWLPLWLVGMPLAAWWALL